MHTEYTECVKFWTAYTVKLQRYETVGLTHDEILVNLDEQKRLLTDRGIIISNF